MAPTSEEHELQMEQVMFISLLIPPLFKLLTEPSVVTPTIQEFPSKPIFLILRLVFV